MNDLEKFITAQQNDYATALAEIAGGKKRSHWMWYIFPQLQALGRSETAKFYGIKDIKEAQAYLKHPLLGSRLKEISLALLQLASSDAHEILGSPDDIKLCSCMTLFSSVLGADNVFEKVLDKFYAGKKDQETLKLLE